MASSNRTTGQSPVGRPRFEKLEPRILLSSLPLTLDFADVQTAGLLDVDGEQIGFTGVQENTAGNAYRPLLLDIDPATGVLRITTTGSSTSGSNSGTNNTLTNGVRTDFDASGDAFVMTTRLRGPLDYLASKFEQAGVMFGPDQDNFLKLVLVARTSGTFIEFAGEQSTGGGSPIELVEERVSLPGASGINTLDLQLAGDAGTGQVTAYYAVDGGDFIAVPEVLTLTGATKDAFFSATGYGGLIALHKNNGAPITAEFERFDIRKRPSTLATQPTDGEIDVRRDAFAAVDLFLPSSALDPATVNTDHVRLFRVSDNSPIAGSVNTSGGGDSIVFQPSVLLDQNTSYRFELTAGIRDIDDAPYVPFTATFTTGIEGGPPNTAISFEKVALTTTNGNTYTTVTIGPDGNLYAGTFDGRVLRFGKNPDGTLTAPVTISSLQALEAGPRLLTGIVFDPASTANDLTLWVTHGDFTFDITPAWSSKVTKLTGTNLGTAEHAVVGLPRANHNHLVNQPVFGPDGALYVSMGGNTAQGAVDTTWGTRPERLLSAAMLRIDTSLLPTTGPLDVQTEDTATPYDPYAAGAPLTLYATGIRNAYDAVWTADGYFYVPNNGSNAGGSAPTTPTLPALDSIRIDGDGDGNPANGQYDGPAVPALNPVTVGQPDLLYEVEQGGYYGHPNPKRWEFVLNGGNPTAGQDPLEISVYPVGVQPDRNYRGIAWNFGAKHSTNGIIEYGADSFNSTLQGKLLVVRFSGGDDIVILSRDPDGSITGELTGVPGLTGFNDPLDLIEDPATGNIYVAEFGGQRLTLVRPIEIAAPAVPANPVAFAADLGQVDVRWFAVPQAELYRIERQGPGDPGFVEIGTATTATTFSDTDVDQLSTYTYRVRAENTTGNSDWTAGLTVTAPAAGRWSPGIDLPVSATELRGAVIGDKIFVVGEGTADTLIFDLTTQSWSTGAARPFTADPTNAEHAAHAINGKLYLFGGLTGGSENKVQIYDPSSNTWTLGADMPFNTGSALSVVINGEVYLAGGAVTTPSYGPVSQAAKYDPVTNSWTLLASMPAGRHASSAGTDGTLLYVFGGRDQGLEPSDGTDTVFIYDPATDTWDSSDNPQSGIPVMPRLSRGTSDAVFYNGEFHIFGGENSSGNGTAPGNVFNTVLIYNPVSATWRQGPPMITARHAVFAGLYQDKIYTIGGGTQSGTSDTKTVEVLDLLDDGLPQAASALTAVAVSPARVDLAWTDNASTEDGFRIWRSTDGVNFNAVATAPADATTLVDLTVTPDTTYTYAVSAFNAAGDSGLTNESIATTPPVSSAPGVPGNLAAVIDSPTQITLAWDPDPQAEQYRLQRQGPGETAFTDHAVLSTVGYVDTGLTDNTTYLYRVQAENSLGVSGYTASLSVTLPLQPAFTGQDIGNPTPVGGSSTVIEGEAYDVVAGGADIWNNADQFHFLSGDVNGDFDVKVRVASLTQAHKFTKAGIMARETTDAGSRHVFMLVTPGSAGHRFAYRSSTDGTSSSTGSGAHTFPDNWLRLERIGNTFTGYRSADGQSWTQTGSLTVGLNADLLLGLAATSHNSSSSTTAQFRDYGDFVSLPLPAAPTGLAITNATTTQVQLAWTDHATDETGYRVFRSEAGGTFTLLTTAIPADATAYTDATTTAGVDYAYHVQAFNASGASASSNTVSVTTPLSDFPPAAPSSLVATASSSTQVQLTWVDHAADETGFDVYRSTDNVNFVLTGSAAADATSYDDSAGLQPVTTYYYYVQAVNTAGASAPSNTDSVTTPAPSVPDAPANLATTAVTPASVGLTWDPAADATGYRVERQDPGNPGFVEIGTPAGTSFTDNTAQADTSYDYRVLAENAVGVSAPSVVLNVNTPAAPSYVGEDIGAPGLAGSFTELTPDTDYDVTGSGSNVWDRSDQFYFVNREATGDFDVSVRLSSLEATDSVTKAGLMARESNAANSRNAFALATPGSVGQRFSSRASTGGKTSSSGSGVATYPNAWLRLQRVGDVFTGYRSSDGVNWVELGSRTIAMGPTVLLGMAVSSHTNAATATAQFRDYAVTGSVSPPATPTGLAANAFDESRVDLTWTDNATDETGYEIFRSTDGVQFALVGQAGVDAAAFSDTSVVPSTTYHYVVRAVSGAIASADSNVAMATTPAASNPPAVPTGFTAVATAHDTVTLDWDDTTGAELYRVERQGPGDTGFVEIGTTTSSGYVDAAVVAQTGYSYRVLAENIVGSSAYTAVQTVTTPAEPSLQGTDIGTPALAGSFTELTPNQDYDVTGNGDNIWNRSDQFYFVHQQVSGDFNVAVRLASLEAVDSVTKAGIMARESLDANSRNAFALATPGSVGQRFSSRASTAGKTSSAGSGVATYPNAWLRLERVGDVFTAYRSDDGVNWVALGSRTIAMGTSVYLGLAVTSHDIGSTATAQFRDYGPLP